MQEPSKHSAALAKTSGVRMIRHKNNLNKLGRFKYWFFFKIDFSVFPKYRKIKNKNHELPFIHAI
jgi:hypothetical protein